MNTFFWAQFRYYGQGPRVGYEVLTLNYEIRIVSEVIVRDNQPILVKFVNIPLTFSAHLYEYRPPPQRRGDTTRRNLAPALQNAGQREPQQEVGAGNNFPTFFETGEQPNDARMLPLGETLTKDDFFSLGNFYLEKKLVLRNFEVSSDDCDFTQGDKLYPIIVNKSSKGGKGGDPWRDNAQVYCLTEIMDLLESNRNAVDPNTRKPILTIHIMTVAEVKAWTKKIIRDMSAQGVQAWKERLAELYVESEKDKEQQEEFKRKFKEELEKELEKEFENKKAKLKEELEKQMLINKEAEVKKERMKRKRKRRSGGDGSGADGDLSTSRSRFQALKL